MEERRDDFLSVMPSFMPKVGGRFTSVVSTFMPRQAEEASS